MAPELLVSTMAAMRAMSCDEKPRPRLCSPAVNSLVDSMPSLFASSLLKTVRGVAPKRPEVSATATRCSAVFAHASSGALTDLPA